MFRGERDLLPASAYQTYHILAPEQSHWRPASCEEVGCLSHRYGWRTRIQGLSPQDVHAARTSGRRYTEVKVEEGETYLVFEPGQRCWKASTHRIRVDRPELYVVRDGDWRGNPTGEARQHTPDGWVNDFAEHQDRIARAVNG